MVAVTGATGLLGSHILERLQRAGVDIIGLHRSGRDQSPREGIAWRTADISDQVTLREALEGATTVIHAAAFVSFNPRRRKQIFEINVEGTRNIVNTCLQLGIKNLIHVSSVSALGRKPGEPVTEVSKWSGAHATDYAESKYLAELEVFRGAEEGLEVGIVNPSVILSTVQLHRSSAALFDYVWKERTFYTEGNLNYVDARDVAEAIFQLYARPRPGEKYILSAGAVTYKKFFELLAEKFGKRAPAVKVSSRLSYWVGWAEEMRGLLVNRDPLITRQSAGTARHSFLYDNRKVKEQLGIQMHSLEETLDWCCADYLRNVKSNK